MCTRIGPYVKIQDVLRVEDRFLALVFFEILDLQKVNESCNYEMTNFHAGVGK